MIADQRFYSRVHALIESSRPRFTTPRVFRLLLDPAAAVARKVFHLIVIFVQLDEELSKRAQQLVMFIARRSEPREECYLLDFQEIATVSRAS